MSETVEAVPVVPSNKLLPICSVIVTANGSSAINLKVPDAAEEATFIHNSVMNHQSLFAQGADCVLIPATNSNGTWKWDLMNRLQVMWAKSKGHLPIVYTYCRIGYINGKKLRLARNMTIYRKPVWSEDLSAEESLPPQTDTENSAAATPPVIRADGEDPPAFDPLTQYVDGANELRPTKYVDDGMDNSGAY